MIRNLTLTLLFVLPLCSANAQVIMRYGPNIDNGWGDASAVVTPYVTFPAEFVSPYAGNNITKVRIGVCAEGTNVYLYIKKDPHDNSYIYRQKLENLKAGWNDVTLDTPFAINGADDIAIGYKASFAKSEGVGYSSEKFSDADMIYYNSKNKWTSTGGSICIQAVVEGEDMPLNEMLIGKMADQTADYDSLTATFSAIVRNVGANEIDSYTAICSYDGEDEVLTVNHNLPVNASDTITFKVPASTPGIHNIVITIDKVNGQPDAYTPNNTSTATLTVRDKAFRRRVVCEEYSGTWCGWCPRGIVGLEKMKEKYPEQFIAISVHGGDELEIDAEQPYSYKPFINSCTGAPSCNVDRKLSGDPYYDIQNLFNMETASENHIAYSLTGEWNADSTAITLHSVYYSDMDMSDLQYNIAYAVTEDSITGYAQTNYYAGGGNGEMDGWENKDEHDVTVCYNDLARAIYSNYAGDPCGTDAMEAGKEYETTSTIPVPPTVRNKKNIHVVGQIIDRNSGYIQNAMSIVPVAGETTDGIAELTNTDPNIGISRIGNIIDIIANDENCRDMRASVYNPSGVCLMSKPFVNGSARMELSGKGLCIIKVYNDKRNIYTTKLIY